MFSCLFSHPKRIAAFVGGVLFGSAGLKLLSSQDAKKAYVQITAAALRCKDSVMESAERVQECAEDILADAKAVNEKRAGGPVIVEDASAADASSEA